MKLNTRACSVMFLFTAIHASVYCFDSTIQELLRDYPLTPIDGSPEFLEKSSDLLKKQQYTQLAALYNKSTSVSCGRAMTQWAEVREVRKEKLENVALEIDAVLRTIISQATPPSAKVVARLRQHLLQKHSKALREIRRLKQCEVAIKRKAHLKDTLKSTCRLLLEVEDDSDDEDYMADAAIAAKTSAYAADSQQGKKIRHFFLPYLKDHTLTLDTSSTEPLSEEE